MTKCDILLFYATIVGSFYGLLAESPGSQAKLQNIEGKLHVLLMGQNKVERQLEVLLQKLAGVEIILAQNTAANPSKFEQIGSKFYYIESKNLETWYNAAHICIRMGGHLASIQSEEELWQITEKTKETKNYWVDINDLVNEGEYMSASTSRRATFIKWKLNQSNNSHGQRDCVYLNNGLMQDYGCHSKENYICEADINLGDSI